ncbi:hypothetical protein QYE76_071103 [Lolium multiflorum]|uniref:Uncharacterized protein n=1 Tax=Lolium multiflorum TaxID=4521 RepID=A0AAD8WEJ8_LOLMU|nr:hypothetical protein QYE76_071103 [Lolium multiflorum]
MVTDYPGYAYVSAQVGHGFNGCVKCMDETPHLQLPRDPGSSKTVYPGARRWLRLDHPWRKRGDLFNGKDEPDGPPRPRSGAEIDDLLKNWKECPAPGKKRPKPEPLLGVWKARSVFHDLEYWKVLHMPHSLDVMHITKNVTESLLGTLCNSEKSKDGPKARYDLKHFGIMKDFQAPDTDDNDDDDDDQTEGYEEGSSIARGGEEKLDMELAMELDMKTSHGRAREEPEACAREHDEVQAGARPGLTGRHAGAPGPRPGPTGRHAGSARRRPDPHLVPTGHVPKSSKEIFSELDETFAQGPIFARSFRTEDLTKWAEAARVAGRAPGRADLSPGPVWPPALTLRLLKASVAKPPVPRATIRKTFRDAAAANPISGDSGDRLRHPAGEGIHLPEDSTPPWSPPE